MMNSYNCNPDFEFDEKRDFELSPFWYLDATHSVPPWTPMFGWFWVNCCNYGCQSGAEKLSLPSVKGWDWRYRNGGGYIRILTVKDPKERKEREEKFRKEIRPFVEDYENTWGNLLNEMLERYNKLKSVDLNHCSNMMLLENFEETINTCRRMWEIHMYMMYGLYTGFVLFEDLAKQLLDIDDADPLFLKLTSGFDNKSFQVDKELYNLADFAKELNLKEVFIKTPTSNMQNALMLSEKGIEFLEKFNLFLEQEAGWRMERMAEINIPTWSEDPSPAFNFIKNYFIKDFNYNLDKEREKREKERLEAEQEVIKRIEPEQRTWFKTILKLAQNCSKFSEEHNLYLDVYMHAMIRRNVLVIGERFAKAGTIKSRDDIFYLLPDEVRKAGINPDMFDFSEIAKERKITWQGWCEKDDNPPFLIKDGYTSEQAMEELALSCDPIALKVFVGSMPVPKPGVKADIFGICGSSGVTEGIVKLISTESELSKIEKGDILVATTTSPSWTTSFSMLNGVVVDRGASLSHAAIVGREYGIPVLINTFEATKILKDGMKIRLDANMGTITILEK